MTLATACHRPVGRRRSTRLAACLLFPVLLAGCRSSKKKDHAPPPEETTSSGTADATGRDQMQVDFRVQGADADAEGSKITLDYPVFEEKNDILPDWVINPGIGGVLGSVGVAAKSRLGMKEQMNEARLNARLEIAYMLELRLQNVGRGQLEQQVQAVGTGLQDNSRKSILDVDRNIADIVLAGSRQRALWFDPESEECYVWMVLDGGILQKVAHYTEDGVSIFVANTPITNEYRPERRAPQQPTVIVEVPSAPAAPAPPKEPIQRLEENLKPIETIPLKEKGEGDE